jgi:2-keto-3-deoxy-L-arabinonate dehydratase
MDITPQSHLDHSLRGGVPIVPTPFTDREEVDHEALEGLVAVSAGVKGVCLPAYGSEFYKLTEQERG